MGDDEWKAVAVEKRTGFRPDVHGFAFPNAFVDVFATLPTGAKITTRGRCGGMAYLSLDLFHASAPAPRWGSDLWAPQRVPPDDNWLADAIRARLFDSFRVLSAASFLTWSVLGDGDTGPLHGVRRRTTDELAQVVRSVDEGRPVPLGLVIARSIGAIGKNHQVVAHGYVREGGVTSVLITDSNSPGREVRLTPSKAGWVASNGPTWRGFFVQDYRAEKPVVLTSRPADPARAVRRGDVVALSHAWTGATLHADGRRVAGVHATASDAERWELVAPDGPQQTTPDGWVDGDLVALRHVRSGSYLASRAGARSPVTGQQLVELGDKPEAWRLEVDGGGPWCAGARTRLVHVATGAALHSHLRSSAATGGRQEVTGFAARDTNDWWTVLESR